MGKPHPIYNTVSEEEWKHFVESLGHAADGLTHEQIARKLAHYRTNQVFWWRS